MAKRSDLKKDIDYLVGQVVMECFDYIYNTENSDTDGAYEIIGEILVTRNKLRSQVNHPDGKDNSGMVKKYYHELGKRLMEACNSSYEKLGQLANA